MQPMVRAIGRRVNGERSVVVNPELGLSTAEVKKLNTFLSRTKCFTEKEIGRINAHYAGDNELSDTFMENVTSHLISAGCDDCRSRLNSLPNISAAWIAVEPDEEEEI